MTRAQMVRADTLDLQDADTPSAKDHSRQPTQPSPLGEGPPAPHQANALKTAVLEGLELRSRSPRASQDLSGKEIQLLQNHDEGDEAVNANIDEIGVGSDDEDGTDEGDEGLEDDMMDKISSSPSIDDGGLSSDIMHYPKHSILLSRHHRATPEPLSIAGSSPYIDIPEYLPLEAIQLEELSPAVTEEEYASAAEDLLEINQALRQSMTEEERRLFWAASQEDVLSEGSVTMSESSDSEIEDIRGPPRTTDDLARYRSIYASDIDREMLSIWDNVPDLRPSQDSRESSPKRPEFRFLSHLLDTNQVYGHTHVAFRVKPSEHYGIPEPPDSNVTSPNPFLEEVLMIYREGYDDVADFHFSPNSSYVAFGYPIRSLPNSEDIDFEFVYALHTFVATVEGQANATKGDTMVLLDDSNSYWWLVRIVKDSSIGYLPAEHIETPTERLARLNKHRNIDLSATMLGDNTEKARSNPLRKARKRRNAKSVAFAEPTYFEPSEHEYSSDEDGSPDDMEFLTTADAANEQTNGDQATEADTAVEPTKAKDESKENGQVERNAAEIAATTAIATGAAAIASDSIKTVNDDTPRASTDSLDDGSTPKKTRIRNTDSFYKDDSIETRRINLTPSLLREDKAAAPVVEPPQINRTRSSSESTTKSTTTYEKPPEKRKEKKSVLGRLFKAKNSKKAQAEEEAEEWIAKDLTEKPTSRTSGDAFGTDVGTSVSVSTKNQPTRTGSKLTKAPPQKSSSFNKGSAKEQATTTPVAEPTVTAPQLDIDPIVSPITSPIADESTANNDQATPASQATSTETSQPSSIARSLSESKNRNLFTPIRAVLGSTPESSSEQKPEKVKKAATRAPIDDSDDSDDPAVSDQNLQNTNQGQNNLKERLSESPVHVGAMNGANHYQHSTNDQGKNAGAVASSGSSTPELIEKPSQDMGASNASTNESSAGSSKKDNFSWERAKKWFDDDFSAWHTCLMDVSDEMKGFNWKDHWAYKDIAQNTVEQYEGISDELEWSQVDYWEIEKRHQQGQPQYHPAYRQIGWEKQWMQHEQSSLREGKDPGWLPWNDPEFSYLYPHRPSPVGAAEGPPAGSIARPQHELKIIGPAALTMKLPDLTSTVAKGHSPYPNPPTLADIDQRLEAEMKDIIKS